MQTESPSSRAHRAPRVPRASNVDARPSPRRLDGRNPAARQTISPSARRRDRPPPTRCPRVRLAAPLEGPDGRRFTCGRPPRPTRRPAELWTSSTRAVGPTSSGARTARPGSGRSHFAHEVRVPCKGCVDTLTFARRAGRTSPPPDSSAELWSAPSARVSTARVARLDRTPSPPVRTSCHVSRTMDVRPALDPMTLAELLDRGPSGRRGASDGERRDLRNADGVLGDAPEQDVAETAPSVRAHADEVCTDGGGDLLDSGARVAERGRRGDGHGRPCARRDRILERLLRLRFDPLAHRRAREPVRRTERSEWQRVEVRDVHARTDLRRELEGVVERAVRIVAEVGGHEDLARERHATTAQQATCPPRGFARTSRTATQMLRTEPSPLGLMAARS